LTIAGLSFGMADLTATASVVSVGVCATAAWTTGTSLQCNGPVAGSGFAVALVTVSASVGTQLVALTFDAPLATSVLPVNAATSAGVSLTLSGDNFGTVDATPSAALGSSGCLTTVWSSDSSVVCTPMGGSGRALLGGVSVSSVVGTVLSSFTYDAPAVTRGRSMNVAMSELAWVTLTGLSFGPGDSTVSATVGSVVCGTASWTTSTTVRCYAGMSTGGSAQYLTVAGLVGTGTGVLSFDGAHALRRARY
jgi:hypothetical protein